MDHDFLDRESIPPIAFPLSLMNCRIMISNKAYSYLSQYYYHAFWNFYLNVFEKLSLFQSGS